MDSKQKNLEAQDDEILALKSIFDENVLTVDEVERKGRFLASVVLPTVPFPVIIKTAESENENNEKILTEVEHLPPIELYFELTRKYPSTRQPSYLIQCDWLSTADMSCVCTKLDSLWKEAKCEVLFAWFTFLQNDLLPLLGYSKKLDITKLINVKRRKSYRGPTFDHDRARREHPLRPADGRGLGPNDQRVVPHNLGMDLLYHLKVYDENKRTETFRAKYVNCSVCFSTYQGSECVVFSCLHTNCKNCVTEYFRVQILEGSVHSLKCPEPECDNQASPELVRKLVGEELFQRYDQLLLSSVLGSMGDIVYCPRLGCQSPVVSEPDDSLALCTVCRFAFCIHCKFAYHGISPCRLFKDDKERQAVLLKYRDAKSEEKAAMEKIYGKKQLQEALNEILCEMWIEQKSKKCPSCKANIEKSEGCNKMSCWRCNAFFCWLCECVIATTTNPYLHFNDPQSKCFNKLFYGFEFDEDVNLEDDLE